MRSLAAGVLLVVSVAAGAQSAVNAPAAPWGRSMTPGMAPVSASRPPSGSAPILVELFTSEGCSSCPPADELLGKLSGKMLPSGRTILTISEHVTYWNHDGWEDPFSNLEATRRQQSYVDRLKVSEGPYTPQMVVDGSEQVSANDRPAVAEALKSADQHPSGVVLTMSNVAIDKGSAEIHFELTGETGKPRRLEVTAFVTDDEDQVQVKAGENAHRTLTHATVARAMEHVDLPKGALTGVVRVKLPGKPPVGAGSGRHLVVVAQEEGDGAMLAAATRAL